MYTLGFVNEFEDSPMLQNNCILHRTNLLKKKKKKKPETPALSQTFQDEVIL